MQRNRSAAANRSPFACGGGKMIKKTLLILISVFIIFAFACQEKGPESKQENKEEKSTVTDTQAPRVVSTFPENESQYVDSTIKEISVTFNEKMKDGNWSWAYTHKSEFPHVMGQAYYTDNFTKCVLPVKLEADKEYIIWINSETQKNFKDINGNPSYPFKFTFKTR
jgi:Bacterial Ig-like domain